MSIWENGQPIIHEFYITGKMHAGLKIKLLLIDA